MKRSRKKSAMEWILCAFAFCLPLTIVIAEPLWILFILAGLTASRPRHWRKAIRNPVFFPAVLYIGWAGLSLLWSVRPEQGLSHLHRLLFPLGIFVAGSVFHHESEGDPRILQPVLCYIGGTCALALYDIVRVPLQVAQGTPLLDTANMRDPQFYMVASCLLLGGSSLALAGRRRVGLIAGLCLSLAGLILHFKRGVWLSFLAAAGLLVLLTRRWRLMLILVALALSLLLLPQVRARLGQLREVTDTRLGGRYALWTEVAPALFDQYPNGMGWCAVQADDLKEHAEYVQPHLNHLHSNALQIRLETGWVGVGLWLLWMGSIFWVMVCNLRRSRPGRVDWALDLGLLCGFFALMLNGLVEYNFGDSEILMLMCFLAGCASARRVDPPDPSEG